MNRVRKPVLLLAALLALLPTLLVIFAFLPTYVRIGPAPAAGFFYGFIGGWLLSEVARGMFSRRFTPLERSVLEFWGHTFFFILIIFVVLAAFPLIVVPAVGGSLGWSFLSSTLYMRSVSLLLFPFSGLAVWGLWRKHWASLLAAREAEERAA